MVVNERMNSTETNSRMIFFMGPPEIISPLLARGGRFMIRFKKPLGIIKGLIVETT
jgi:hypothetical protein